MSAASGNQERVFHGIAVSAGVIRAKIHVIGRRQVSIKRRDIPAGESSGEISRLEQALLTTRHQIQEVQSRLLLKQEQRWTRHFS